MTKFSEKYERSYDRSALRTAFVSLFWVVISARKKRPGGFTLQALAKAIGSSKHEVSRWFNGDPNWTLNTIANIAHALDLDLIVQAKERSTGIVYTSAGAIQGQQMPQLTLGSSTATSAMTTPGSLKVIRFPHPAKMDVSSFKPRRLGTQDIPTAGSTAEAA